MATKFAAPCFELVQHANSAAGMVLADGSFSLRTHSRLQNFHRDSLHQECLGFFANWFIS